MMAHVIEIQRAARTGTTPAGTPIEGWSKLATLRAELIAAGTTEFLATQGARDEEALVFRTRFLAGVTTADRVTFAGQSFDIRGIVPIGRRKGLELRCIAIKEGP